MGQIGQRRPGCWNGCRGIYEVMGQMAFETKKICIEVYIMGRGQMSQTRFMLECMSGSQMSQWARWPLEHFLYRGVQHA